MKWIVVVFVLTQCEGTVKVESKGNYITQEECVATAKLYNDNWRKMEPGKTGLHYSCIEIPELKP